ARTTTAVVSRREAHYRTVGHDRTVARQPSRNLTNAAHRIGRVFGRGWLAVAFVITHWCEPLVDVRPTVDDEIGIVFVQKGPDPANILDPVAVVLMRRRIGRPCRINARRGIPHRFVPDSERAF